MRGTGGPHDRKRMTLQAQQVHLADGAGLDWWIQRRGVWHELQPSLFNGNMLGHERFLFVSVALVAGCVAAG